MAAVLRLSKVLQLQAGESEQHHRLEFGPVVIRPYRGPEDSLHWRQVQDEALARLRGGRSRTDADFHRLWLAQRWWQPDRLLFACPGAGCGTDPDRKGNLDYVLGTVGFRPVTASTACLFWLAVRPAWQRRGVGRLLVEAVERQCCALGIERLEAETLPAWAAAVAFYQSLDFSID